MPSWPNLLGIPKAYHPDFHFRIPVMANVKAARYTKKDFNKQYLETNLCVRTDLEAAISFAVDQSC